MLALTSDIPTWAHRVPAAAKFAVLFGATLAILLIDALAVQVAILVATVALYLSCGWRFARAGLRALRAIALVAALIGLWHLWRGAPDTAALVVLRLVSAVALAGFLTMTTRLDAILALVERGLAALAVPQRARRRIALALALVIRFVPVLAQKGAALTEAWRARSPRRLSPRIVLPLTLMAIDDAENVAEALRARGGA